MMTAHFNHLWQSAVLAVAVALLSLAFRRNHARLRYGSWFAAVKFLVPPVGGADLKARINAMLANRIGVSLTLSKGIVLAAAAVVSLVVPIATGAIDAALTAAQLPAAQGPPVDPETRFEVASIKRSDPSAVPQIRMSPGRYNVAGVRVGGIISDALRVPPNRITGLPDWSLNERYTIAAKAPEGAPSTDGRAMFVMLTNLLKDRFRMAMHTETREMPVYNLVFTRSDKRFGRAFKESSAECRAALAVEEVRGGARATGRIGPSKCESVRINPGGTASLHGVPMDMIARILTPYVGRPVIDKTGLTSYYDVTLKWTPNVGSASLAPPALPPGTLPLDPDAPNLFTAVQEQLGLKLENARAPLDVVVIDSVEHPTPD
jgi:bla regulator protein blaR1